MLDNKYLLELLRAIAESPYQGISNLQLVEKFIGPAASVPDNDPDSAYKFRYHMEEIWRAGLIRNRDTNSDSWGLSLSASGSWMIMQMPLVLSPSGGALLEELEKPQGLEKLKSALQSVGISAGHGALQAAISQAFS